MVATSKFTNLQLELIKMFSMPLSEVQLFEIRDILTAYFAETASKEMDKLWSNNNWTDETMQTWANEHLRTPYNKKL